jgi:hypothetical protein
MMDRPPGIQPNSALDNRISRLGAPLSESKYPANVKSGMATRTGVVAIRCISMMMADMSIWLEKSRKRVKPAMTTKMGIPISKSMTAMATISREVISVF